ncbi:MAG: WHG domain-containing protein [Pseudonocardiaceae bacterium]
MSPARPTAGTPYARAQQTGRQALRSLILDTASTLLEAEGPSALTMRRISSEVGCSTTVLYTMFGGKPGIAEGLWCEGFDRLKVALAEVEGPDPLSRLAAMGRTYRTNALANRSYYAVMFQRPIPGFEPSPEAYETSLAPLLVLTDAVADCIESGVFRPGDPAHIAGVLWAAAHGAVSLELAGYEGAHDAEARFTDLSAAAGRWFMAARPGTPQS